MTNKNNHDRYKLLNTSKRTSQGRCFSPSTCKNHGRHENYQEIVKILEEELAKRDHEDV